MDKARVAEICIVERSPSREHPGSQFSQPRQQGVADEADTRPGGSPLKQISNGLRMNVNTKEVKRRTKLARRRLP